MPRRALIVIASLIGALPGAAMAAPTAPVAVTCLATDAMEGKRWAEAERILRENRRRAACAGEPMLVFTLAYAVHQLSKTSPARACEARDLFDEALRTMPPEDELRGYARQSRATVAAICGCLPPGRALADARWAEAEAQLDARIADPACAASRDSLELARAQVIEKQVGDAPRRACEVEALYGNLAATVADAALREVEAGARRMGLICRGLVEDCARLGDEDANGLADCADPACAGHMACALPEDDTALVLGVSAGAAGAAGAALYGIGYFFDVQSEDATRDDFDRYHDRAVGFGIGGLAVLTVAVGLGVAALVYDGSDDGAAAVGPGGPALGFTF